MKKNLLWIGIGVIALVAIGGWIWFQSRPGSYDEFAQCLKNNGAVFYGAFWCPNCQNQKEKFGRSERLLPYVECSTPDGRNQIQACKDREITGYPTWEFKDGSRLVGDLPLRTLGEKTSCELPQGQ